MSEHWDIQSAKHRANLRAAARRVACGRDMDSYVEDLVQEVLLLQLSGQRVRMDRVGLSRVMHTLLTLWTHCRRNPMLVQVVAEWLTPEWPSAITLADLQSIYNESTEAQREAIFQLLTGAASGMSQAGRAQALKRIRRRIGLVPPLTTAQVDARNARERERYARRRVA